MTLTQLLSLMNKSGKRYFSCSTAHTFSAQIIGIHLIQMWEFLLPEFEDNRWFKTWRSWPQQLCSDAQWCPALCHRMNCSLPGSSVHGILQARTLPQVAISFSRGSSRPKDWTCVSCFSHTGGWIPGHFPAPPGSLTIVLVSTKAGHTQFPTPLRESTSAKKTAPRHKRPRSTGPQN